MTSIRYIKKSGTFLVRHRSNSPDSSGSQQLLLGARVHIDEASITDGWVKASTMPKPDKNSKLQTQQGFVELSRLSKKQQLKIFYLDVGQGDATLIEAEGAIVIIDGGPNSGFFTELMKRLKNLQRADKALGINPRSSLHINAIIVSHFDADHYVGLTKILASKKITVGTLYHNGLTRYGVGAQKDLNLGNVVKHSDKTRSISVDLGDIDSARELVNSDLLLTKNNTANKFSKFLKAAISAHDNNRLNNMQRLVRRKTEKPHPILQDTGPDMRFEVLGPVTTRLSGAIRLRAFPDPHNISATNPHPAPSESHTINGNSIVLRLVYGETTFLFGGDLNQPAQTYLKERYQNMSIFRADVNKACHHGSSDFDLPYLQSVSPNATVFSSGDNGSHDHPLPDAMGAAAKYSRGKFPLVFSTELARETSINKKKIKIKLGHINARSNGTNIVMAQKKEKPSLKKTWHSFQLPFAGPFADNH